MNNRIWHAIEVEIDRIGETAATTQLWLSGTTGLEVSEDSPATITLRAYFDSKPDVAKLRNDIVRCLTLSELSEASLKRLDYIAVADQDWLAEWKKGYEPVEIGNKILICPSWKRDELQNTDRVIVEIDPGMAFGTGTHETTRGCLEMLEKFWRGGSLLDVGTGTGILAIAAYKLFPESTVKGFDNDPEAIIVADENAEINNVADKIKFKTDTIESYVGGGFDTVLANLTADVITLLAEHFPKVMKPNATLIVSGILQEQGDNVRSTLSKLGYKEIDSKPDGEWDTIALRFI